MTDWKAEFKAYTTASLVGQIRMDARSAFTPEDEAYLIEIADRLERLSKEAAKEAGHVG